jgi:dTDP-4-amino-4,6-dideoxygalactose transaminase
MALTTVAPSEWSDRAEEYSMKTEATVTGQSEEEDLDAGVGTRLNFPEPLHVGRPNIGPRHEFDRLVDGIFERHWLTNAGPLVVELERRIADFLDVRHCVTMANGTVALEIAIRALGLTGEVIVPSYTFIATAHALHWQDLTPVFADIDERTHNIDPESVRTFITPKTSGIIGVHLWGRPAPVKELQALADEHGLALLFDAAHAFGNSHNGRMIGSFGRAEVLSFHATKFFNTFEGGAVVTNDDDLAEQMRLMRNFGFVDFDEVVYPGTNGKMAEVCAAMGLVNLDALDGFVARNVENYSAYEKVFAASNTLHLRQHCSPAAGNHQYVVVELAPSVSVHRDKLVADLHVENVRARKYFWPGCHNMEPYKSLFPHAGVHLPNTKMVSDRVVVLPTGSAVEPDDCRRIGEFIVSKLTSY